MKITDYFFVYLRKIRFIFLFFFLLFSIGLIPLLTEWGFAYVSEIIQMLLGLVLLASLLSIVTQRLLSLLLIVVSLMVVLKLLYLVVHINVILPTSNLARSFFV